MTTARRLLQALGAPGIAAIGVLLLCLGFYFSAVRPAERELAAQRLSAERLRSRAPERPVRGVQARAEELLRFYRLFPPLVKLPDELERLYELADKAHLELPRGNYRLDDDGALVAYHVTLPLHGPYSSIRGFLAMVLQSLPVASVDALRIGRGGAGDPSLKAQLELTLYFRSREAGAGR
ncbi:MAG: hypothetical protein M0015_11700 [Betaproteobacteria bacterium]|nr:hypothetical protein [Betaproteobacteria bacterium]